MGARLARELLGGAQRCWPAPERDDASDAAAAEPEAADRPAVLRGGVGGAVQLLAQAGGRRRPAGADRPRLPGRGPVLSSCPASSSATSYLPAAQAGRFRYGGFLWARVARIYPLHLVTMAVIAVLGAAALLAGRRMDPNVLSPGSVLPNLLLVHAGGSRRWRVEPRLLVDLGGVVRLSELPGLRLARPALGPTAPPGGGRGPGLPGRAQRRLPEAGRIPPHPATFQWGALRIVPSFAYGCALYLLWRSGVVQGRIAPGRRRLAFGRHSRCWRAIWAADPLLTAAAGGLILCLACLSDQTCRCSPGPRSCIWERSATRSTWSACRGSFCSATRRPLCSIWRASRCRYGYG